MKQLIIARHGDVEKDGLTYEGKQAVQALANSIYKALRGEIPRTLLSSPSERAVATARFLAQLLNSQPPHVLETEDLSNRIMLNDEKKLQQRTERLLTQCTGETGILVTHKEEAESYARIFATMHFNADFGEFEYLCNLGTAEAYHISETGIRILPIGITYRRFGK